jgi:methane monooxygenase component C
LLCSTYPRGDLHIQVPYTHDRIRFQAIQTNWLGEILSCDKVSSNVARHVVQVLSAGGEAPISLNFTPSQFVDIEISETHMRRSYSMASVSADGVLEFFIRLPPDGAFSKFFATTAKVGMRLSSRGPSGSFGLRENSPRSPLFRRRRNGSVPGSFDDPANENRGRRETGRSCCSA